MTTRRTPRSGADVTGTGSATNGSGGASRRFPPRRCDHGRAFGLRLGTEKMLPSLREHLLLPLHIAMLSMCSLTLTLSLLPASPLFPVPIGLAHDVDEEPKALQRRVIEAEASIEYMGRGRHGCAEPRPVQGAKLGPLGEDKDGLAA